ncbi:MAG: aminotransferase class I/II-fold pyridoxal phosphate-dependent enzyme [Deltaproteobacteria bacterium]|nr:aminotransferase class I/II-fold pyridoxal phosphate-dependent enzyme [Deltaproteobacteria bacterium]MBW2364954.1 aminotransferase class I/II-fold pyridoxal phosphate-dependent enzyme [Deltaproteobacteria bacterium]
MTEFKNLNSDELEDLKNELIKRYDEFKTLGIQLDMTRGKPCPKQLDLSLDMLKCANEKHFLAQDGTDCRNYGGLDGIPEAKDLFSSFLGVTPSEIIVGGNASLNMMNDTFVTAMLHGIDSENPPWIKLPQIKFICPSPGYDRHFSICEHLNIEMIPIGMDEHGPDMDTVEQLVKQDENIKGIWCVPMYSNPTGAVYSDEVIERLAGMETKAKDFRIFCDNAYTVHHLADNPPVQKNFLSACKESGNPERVFIFGSTSKVTFAGAGVGMMAGSEKNMALMKKHLAFQSIGPDKINQLRHVLFFKDMDGINAHMKKHREIIKPKFDAVQGILEKEIGALNIAKWSNPKGGYFISLDTQEGCAKKIAQMASEAGLKLTPAGATYPLKKDPVDCNIRIAPTFPPLEDIELAMELLAICIQLVAIDKIGSSSG